MQRVKIFSKSSIEKLENAINQFLTDEINVIDIKFSSSIGSGNNYDLKEFSALMIYEEVTQ